MVVASASDRSKNLKQYKFPPETPKSVIIGFFLTKIDFTFKTPLGKFILVSLGNVILQLQANLV
jgi:hypothetical protein